MTASPTDLEPLDVEREKRRVEEALAPLGEFVRLSWLEGQTWQDLLDEMQAGPWHIFHFIGHGKFNHNIDEGLIALADEQGRANFLRATQLGRVLANHHHLRVVVLNSCEGAYGGDLDIFSSTAAILVQRGIPAVLAMQYEITDMAAIEFSRSFYRTLARGLPIDTAVSYARIAVSLAITHTIEWATPVLYMRSADGQIFDVEKIFGTEPGQIDASAANNPIVHSDTQEAEGQELSELYTIGRGLFDAQEWQRALDVLKQVEERRKNYKDVNSLLEKIREEIIKEEIRNLSTQAENAIERSQWTEAESKLKRLIEIEPVNPLWHVRQGDILCSQSKWAEAEKEFELALRLESSKAEWHVKLADVLQKQNKMREAEKEYRQAVRLEPANIRWHSKLVDLLFYGGKWSEVIEYSRTITDSDANEEIQQKVTYAEEQLELDSLYIRGRGLLEVGQWEQALNHFDRIRDLEDNYRDVNTLINRAQEGKKKADNAQREGREKERKNEASRLYNDALLAIGQEDWATAIDKLKAAQSLDPDNEELKAKIDFSQQQQQLSASYTEARREYESGNWHKAITLFRAIQSKAPEYKDVDTCIQLANKQIKNKQIENLFAYVQGAIEEGDWTRANEHLGNLLALDPHNQEAANKLKYVEGQQELSRNYERGLKFYEAKRWQDALICFYEVKKSKADYKEVNKYIAAIRTQLAASAGAPRKSKLVRIALLVILIGGAAYITMFLFNGQKRDVTPPIISQVNSSNINAHGASITWTTDEDSYGEIEYGLTSQYELAPKSSPIYQKNHEIILTDLSPNTVYHYRVKSNDIPQNKAMSEDMTFRTLPVVAPVPIEPDRKVTIRFKLKYTHQDGLPTAILTYDNVRKTIKAAAGTEEDDAYNVGQLVFRDILCNKNITIRVNASWEGNTLIAHGFHTQFIGCDQTEVNLGEFYLYYNPNSGENWFQRRKPRF